MVEIASAFTYYIKMDVCFNYKVKLIRHMSYTYINFDNSEVFICE